MMAQPMKIKSIAPWFGGKRTLAPRIVRELGQHVSYFEPFCGSMAVLLAKAPSRQETVNDLHGDLVNLAVVLSDRALAGILYDRLIGTLVCEELLCRAQRHLEATDLDGSDILDRAYWYFLACWVARNGTSGTIRQDYKIAVRWTNGGGSPATRFRSAIDSIPAWHERLRNVVILQRDAFEIIPRFEDAAATAIYADPPYPAETRANLGRGGGGGGQYLHEFEHSDSLLGCDDHGRLAQMLRRFQQARIVVSSYDCPRIREMYKGWTVVACARQKNLQAMNKRGGTVKPDAPEILLMNGPSITTNRGPMCEEAG